jgi:hypothetical protein
VLESRVLRRILGSRSEELTGGCRCDDFAIIAKYYYSDQVKGNEMVGASNKYENDKKSTQNFAQKFLRQWDSLKIRDFSYLINDDAIDI